MIPEEEHPRSHTGCPACDGSNEVWEKKRNLPDIGETFACNQCDQEVYVKKIEGDHPFDIQYEWRPVTGLLATNLLFSSEVGSWPDDVLEPHYKQGLERMEAIDFKIVEQEGMSQKEWAQKTERNQSTVSENVSKAKNKLGFVEVSIE